MLLVDQPYVDGWSLPGGDLKRGEPVQSGLRRELREEVGLDLDVPVPVLACQRVRDHWVTFVVLVEVTDAQADAAGVSSAELSALAWWPPGSLPPMDPDAATPLQLALGPPPAA